MYAIPNFIFKVIERRIQVTDVHSKRDLKRLQNLSHVVKRVMNNPEKIRKSLKKSNNIK